VFTAPLRSTVDKAANLYFFQDSLEPSRVTIEKKQLSSVCSSLNIWDPQKVPDFHENWYLIIIIKFIDTLKLCLKFDESSREKRSMARTNK
jgi:hypothetical protein